MRKRVISILGMVAVAGLAVWIFEGAGLATHVSNPNAGYSHSNEIGQAQDSIGDDSPSRAGYDRNQDRSPDSTPDQTNDSTPDCGDGPADGQCGNGTGTDSTPDRQASGPGDGAGAGDGSGTPDLFAVKGYNRVSDQIHDDTPDAPMSGSYAGDEVDDRVGRDGRAASIDNTPDATSDRVAADIIAFSDNPRRPNRDGDSRGSDGSVTPDQVTPANADSTSDGVQDRNLTGDLRDSGKLNHSQPGRDAFNKGPGDRTKDNYLGSSSDKGGFGFAPVTSGGGGGGGGGCSLVSTGSVDPMSTVSYLLVLLSPIALVQMRRFVRRK